MWIYFSGFVQQRCLSKKPYSLSLQALGPRRSTQRDYVETIVGFLDTGVDGGAAPASPDEELLSCAVSHKSGGGGGGLRTGSVFVVWG